MSTKINVRSPFYLNIVEPTAPAPSFDCTVANLQGFSIDNQGIITTPTAAVGQIFTTTSADSDFSNNKFAVETSDTSRTVLFTITIPPGFSNSADLYFICSKTFLQPGTSGSGGCSGGPGLSGTIPSKTLNIGGGSIDVELSGFFTGETSYRINKVNHFLINTTLIGSVVTLSANQIAGTHILHAEAFDNSYPWTCAAIQPISVTVNASGQNWSCTSPINPALQGGSIAQDGTITNPQSNAIIAGISLSNGGSLITSVSANTGSAAQNVTLFFKMTVTAGYDNAGATIFCQKVLSQAGTTAKTFTCSIASITGQQIGINGGVILGDAKEGTVVTFTQPSTPFEPVAIIKSRTIVFQVLIPSGYNGANGTATIDCPRTIFQPPTISICGSLQLLRSIGRDDPDDFCVGSYITGNIIKSTAGSLSGTGVVGAQICENGSAFAGGGKYYSVFTSSVSVGTNQGDFTIYQIDNQGIVLQVVSKNCDTTGVIKF